MENETMESIARQTPGILNRTACFRKRFFRYLPYLLCLVVVYILMSKSMRNIRRINDFDVLYHGATLAAQRSPDLYSAPSREGRRYLYPPTSVPYMMPLTWLPFISSGFVFSAVRIAALVAVGALLLAWCRSENLFEGSGRRGFWIYFAAVMVLWRFLNNEAGNGQINVLLSALTFCGVWGAFRPGGGAQAAGGAGLAVATAIKATPLIMVGVLALHRRWKALAAYIVVMAATILFVHAWYGPAVAGSLWAGWTTKSYRMAMESEKVERVASLPELLMTVAAVRGAADPVKETRSQIIILTAVLAAAYLAVRHLKFRGVDSAPPLWDVSLVICAMLFLSPLVRKAHLVHLLPTVGIGLFYIAGRCHRMTDIWKNPRQGWAATALFTIALILLILSTSLPTQRLIPAYPANTTLFLGLVALMGALALMDMNPGKPVIHHSKTKAMETPAETV